MARQVTAPQTAGEQRLRMSYDEWRAWAQAAEVKSEWVAGEVIVHMSTTIRHALVSSFVATLLKLFVEFHRLGQVLIETVEMRLDDRSRVPDILFVANDHLDRLTETRLLGPADLVVEFVSDDSVERDREEKFREYAAAGVPEYWLCDARPGQRRADFFRLVDGGYQAVLPDVDGRYHSLVVPGFWFRPDWLWQAPLPNALACLAAIAPDAVRAALTAPEAAGRIDGA